MNTNFGKYKFGLTVARIVKTVAAALGVGMIFAGALLLLVRLELWQIERYWCVISGACSALVTAAVVWLLLMRSDLAVAKELDKRFRLDERVQTMMEFSGEDGAMLTLQREDTDKALAAIPSLRLNPLSFIGYVAVLLVGVALIVTAFIVPPPVHTDPPPPPEEPFALTDIQAAAITELIGYVEASDMTEPYRTEIALRLSDLLAALRLVDTVNERDELLGDAQKYIFEKTDESSSAVEIINALWQSSQEAAKLLAEALNYYAWPADGGWDVFAEDYGAVRDSFLHPDASKGDADVALMAEETVTRLKSAASAITVSLVKSGIASADSLYAVLLSLAGDGEAAEPESFTSLANRSEGLGYAELQLAIDTILTSHNGAICAAIDENLENTGVGEYVMTRLASILGGAVPKFERPTLRESSASDGAGGGENEGGGIGGIGDGTIYGSDDLVLDPYTDKYVEYGTLIDRYYSLMFGKLQDGDYTDEEKDAMEKYFQILYGGFEESNGGN